MKGDICSIDDCNIIVRTGSICQVHWWRMHKYGSYDKPSRKRYGEICRAEGCDKKRDGRHSVCPMHRSRLSRYKSLEVPIIIYPEGIVHECKIHGYLKLEDSYKNRKTGHYTCVPCRRENDRKFFDNNPHIHRDLYKHHYYINNGKVKLSKSDYKKMYDEQNGKCKICNQTEIGQCFKSSKQKLKRLAIDHCHKTLKIRGLLCQSCNTALGSFKDSIEMLQSAIQYLEKHNGKDKGNET